MDPRSALKYHCERLCVWYVILVYIEVRVLGMRDGRFVEHLDLYSIVAQGARNPNFTSENVQDHYLSTVRYDRLPTDYIGIFFPGTFLIRLTISHLPALHHHFLHHPRFYFSHLLCLLH